MFSRERALCRAFSLNVLLLDDARASSGRLGPGLLPRIAPRSAAASARKTVGLLDSTKFRRDSLLTVRSAQSLDLVITDDGLDEATAGRFRNAGVNLVVAERGPERSEDPKAD